MTGSIAASGSVTSLTDGAGLNPNVTLSDGCYVGMFYDCTSLTTAPELPATTLDELCYKQMFQGCTSLKVSVSENSTLSNKIFTCPSTMPANAVDSMFANCASGTELFTGGTPTTGKTYYWN